jgi:hypothetical protein
MIKLEIPTKCFTEGFKSTIPDLPDYLLLVPSHYSFYELNLVRPGKEDTENPIVLLDRREVWHILSFSRLPDNMKKEFIIEFFQ